MSDNWVIQNLDNALKTWDEKMAEIWALLTQSPQSFKGGALWNITTTIHGTLQAIGYALLVLFFVIGIVKTCGSYAELKRPEAAVKVFVRFALAKGLITGGMELMMALLTACSKETGTEEVKEDVTAAESGETMKVEDVTVYNKQENPETAILVVSFGTSFNDSRVKTIGGIESAIAITLILVVALLAYGFLLTAGLSLLIAPVLYPILKAIMAYGGNLWKE